MKRFILLFAFISALLSSCSSDYTILKSVGSVILKPDSSVKLIDGTITFTVSSVTNNESEDITPEAVIYIDGEPITGNTFSSATVGTFEAKAIYAGLESEPVILTFHDGSEINFEKRVLIEDYTGTWCGYCPRVAHAIELVKEETDNAVAVAIHRPTSNEASLNYDPYNYDASELEALLSTVGYPKGYLNRMTLWQSPEPNNLSQAVGLTQGLNPKLGIAITSVVEETTINLDVNVKFGKDFTGSGIKLVVYVLENGLIYDQVNYTSYYGGDHIVHGFEHNHVLRECLTPLLGEAVTGDMTIANTFTKSFNVPVPANVENAANLEFVAFVTDADGNALNVRSNHPGEDQVFEEL